MHINLGALLFLKNQFYNLFLNEYNYYDMVDNFEI